MENLDRLRKPRRIKSPFAKSPDTRLRTLMHDLVAQRFLAGLTQAEVASRMGTKASAISRLESGKLSRPTLTTLENYALVVGCDVTIAVRPRYRAYDESFPD